MTRKNKATAEFSTPLGPAVLEGGDSGISALRLGNFQNTVRDNEIPEVLQVAVSQVQEYFQGQRRHFDFKIAPEGTPFQQRVWKCLLEIPFGTTLSYQELSNRLGNPKAIRAVASANARNPLWIVVPCHRIIGSDGSLTGYAGGIWRKNWLLVHEGSIKQHSLFDISADEVV